MSKENVLLQMKNGGIVKIEDDYDYYAGCDTCDYGSQYISELRIIFTNNKQLIIKTTNEYTFAISQLNIMEIFLYNYTDIMEMTIEYFVSWIKKSIENHCSCRVKFDYKTI